MTERLVSLQAVKDWLGVTSVTSDKALTRIIDAASQFALNYMNRDGFAAQEYTQNFKGTGATSALLRNWPVLSVSSVGVHGSSIIAATPGIGGMYGSGYAISDQRGGPQSIELYGSCFGYRAQCQVVYRAGWETTQSYVIQGDTDGDDPGAFVFTPTNGGLWTVDQGVTGPGGVAWPKVLVGEPGPQEYACDEWGDYTFNIADIGTTVTIDYDFVPMDLSQAVLEMIGLWWRRKDRIGVLSKTLAGQETVTFDKSAMSETCESCMQYYMNVVPI